PAFEAVEISDLSLNDNPTRAIRTLHRSDPRRPGVLLRRYDTTTLSPCHQLVKKSISSTPGLNR
ncbi:hypothetical protein, partial [Propionibacterium freudenreichii]|uniref:hypothetical protein n=1 Tax=Propionibacterium freudenreichii TaxID=1744 RepID=UPI00254ED8CF